MSPDNGKHVVSQQCTSQADRVDPNVVNLCMLEHRDQGGAETTMLVPPLESLFEKKNAVPFNLLITELFTSFPFLNLVCPPFAKVVAQPVRAKLPTPPFPAGL